MSTTKEQIKDFNFNGYDFSISEEVINEAINITKSLKLKDDVESNLVNLLEYANIPAGIVNPTMNKITREALIDLTPYPSAIKCIQELGLGEHNLTNGEYWFIYSLLGATLNFQEIQELETQGIGYGLITDPTSLESLYPGLNESGAPIGYVQLLIYLENVSSIYDFMSRNTQYGCSTNELLTNRDFCNDMEAIVNMGIHSLENVNEDTVAIFKSCVSGMDDTKALFGKCLELEILRLDKSYIIMKDDKVVEIDEVIQHGDITKYLQHLIDEYHNVKAEEVYGDSITRVNKLLSECGLPPLDAQFNEVIEVLQEETVERLDDPVFKKEISELWVYLELSKGICATLGSLKGYIRSKDSNVDDFEKLEVKLPTLPYLPDIVFEEIYKTVKEIKEPKEKQGSMKEEKEEIIDIEVGEEIIEDKEVSIDVEETPVEETPIQGDVMARNRKKKNKAPQLDAIREIEAYQKEHDGIINEARELETREEDGTKIVVSKDTLDKLVEQLEKMTKLIVLAKRHNDKRFDEIELLIERKFDEIELVEDDSTTLETVEETIEKEEKKEVIKKEEIVSNDETVIKQDLSGVDADGVVRDETGVNIPDHEIDPNTTYESQAPTWFNENKKSNFDSLYNELLPKVKEGDVMLPTYSYARVSPSKNDNTGIGNGLPTYEGVLIGTEPTVGGKDYTYIRVPFKDVNEVMVTGVVKHIGVDGYEDLTFLVDNGIPYYVRVNGEGKHLHEVSFDNRIPVIYGEFYNYAQPILETVMDNILRTIPNKTEDTLREVMEGLFLSKEYRHLSSLEIGKIETTKPVVEDCDTGFVSNDNKLSSEAQYIVDCGYTVELSQMNWKPYICYKEGHVYVEISMDTFRELVENGYDNFDTKRENWEGALGTKIDFVYACKGNLAKQTPTKSNKVVQSKVEDSYDDSFITINKPDNNIKDGDTLYDKSKDNGKTVYEVKVRQWEIERQLLSLSFDTMEQANPEVFYADKGGVPPSVRAKLPNGNNEYLHDQTSNSTTESKPSGLKLNENFESMVASGAHDPEMVELIRQSLTA